MKIFLKRSHIDLKINPKFSWVNDKFDFDRDLSLRTNQTLVDFIDRNKDFFIEGDVIIVEIPNEGYTISQTDFGDSLWFYNPQTKKVEEIL